MGLDLVLTCSLRDGWRVRDIAMPGEELQDLRLSSAKLQHHVWEHESGDACRSAA